MLYSLVLYISMLASNGEWVEQRIDIQDSITLEQCTQQVKTYNTNLDHNIYFYCEPTFIEP